jgi:spermidine synthase
MRVSKDRAIDSGAPLFSERLLPVLFTISGATSLVIETIFTRLLTYTFGNTAHAVSTVLAVFLAGLSLGAFCVGRLADRWPSSLRFYGALELLAGAYSLLVPTLYGILTTTYVNLCHSFGFGPIGTAALRFGTAVLLVFPAAFFMGGTLPAVARFVAGQREGFEARLDRLYGLNTLGAAAGALISVYILLPCLGVRGTLWLACGLDFAIFIATVSFDASRAQGEALAAPAPSAGARPISRGVSTAILVAGFLTGVLALAYEVTWTHILAFLIGNSVYAFGLMLSVFLCGLGWGARWVGREHRDPGSWPWVFAISQMALGIVVLVTLPLWEWVPHVFRFGLSGVYLFDLIGIGALGMALLGYIDWRNRRGRPLGGPPWLRQSRRRLVVVGVAAYALTSQLAIQRFDTSWFLLTELARVLVAFFLLVVPATLLGFCFPLLLNLYTHTRTRAASRVGSFYAANTLGTVAGSIVTGFLLLSWLGALATLRAAAATSALLGLGFAFLFVRPDLRRKAMLAALSAACALVFFISPWQWNEKRIASGAYAYLVPSSWDRIVYFKEDVQGGLTSVGETGPTRVLTTNGKFQGDNTREVPQQLSFAFIPALFLPQFDRALVIGLGTGGTLRGLCDFPFHHVEVAEISPNIVEAARFWFKDVNGGVLDRDPRITLRVTDGRNDLLLSREHYDLITIEITSLWVSGEGDLYNREFYQLCRDHLGQRGVLQQWVALHHLRLQDLLVIFNTAARVFPHLAFFLGPSHGLLIASASPLQCDYPTIQKLDSSPAVAQDLKQLRLPSLWSLLGRMILDGPSMERLLARMPQLTGLPADFASSDFLPYLEYGSPKGLTLPYDTDWTNLRLLLQFESLGAGSSLVANVPSQDECELVQGYIAEGQGKHELALDHFARISGPFRERAQAEAARLNTPSAAANDPK